MIFNAIGYNVNSLLGLSVIHYAWIDQLIIASIISFLIYLSIKVLKKVWVLPLLYFLGSSLLLLTNHSITDSSLVVEFLYSIVGIMSLLFKPFEFFLIGISIYVYILILPTLFLVFLAYTFTIIQKQLHTYHI